MTALSAALQAMRARIASEVAALTLSSQVDTMRHEPKHLVDKRFTVWPDSTRNAATSRQTDGLTTVTDRVTVEIGAILTSGDQTTPLDTALDLADDVRVALTAPTWWKATAGVQCVVYVEERRQRREGYVLITQTYSVTRQDVLG